MQENTVKYLKAEDAINSEPPQNGRQAAADFAKLQEVRLHLFQALTRRLSLSPRGPNDSGCSYGKISRNIITSHDVDAAGLDSYPHWDSTVTSLSGSSVDSWWGERGAHRRNVSY